LNLFKKGSLWKLFKSNPFEGHLERLKDGMLSDAIEGEQSHLESTPIFSLYMPTLDIKFEPIFKPILDPYESSYALCNRTDQIIRAQVQKQAPKRSNFRA
jgi:hypothetical protein